MHDMIITLEIRILSTKAPGTLVNELRYVKLIILNSEVNIL